MEGEFNKRLKIFLEDERVGYAIVTPKATLRTRMRSQVMILSAEQEAIIKAIFISKSKGATVIATNSLTTMMAVVGTSVRDEQKPKDETKKGAT
jgi:hypothetical protein